MIDPAGFSTTGSAAPPPDLPIVVRRARPGDTRAVLDFTRGTWDGWDYIPRVWQAWLEAPDGVLLVATPNVHRQLDLYGRPLSPDRPIGIARVAILSEREAWLEGLRVDPGVRQRGVARRLHGACLVWARAQGATTVRYATGEENEGSHRLGAYHGFRLLRPWRSYQPPREPVADVAEDTVDAEAVATSEDELADLADEAPGEVPLDVATRAAGAPMEAASSAPAPPAHASPVVSGPGRAQLRRAGLVLDPRASREELARWWARIDADETFALGDRLYEFRSWAFQELTMERFTAHVRSGEVLVHEVAAEAPASTERAAAIEAGRPAGPATRRGGRHPSHPAWGLAIMPLERDQAAGERPWAALVAGDGDAVLRLAVAARQALGHPVRLRVPDGAPLVADRLEAFVAAGFPPADGALHILARHLGPDDPIDLGPPGAVLLADPPRRVATPPVMAR